MKKNGKTIVVLGGGIGGVVAAHELSKRLTREHEIVLVEIRKTNLYQPALLWTALGRKNISDFESSFDSFAKKRIRVVNAEILGIDPEKKLIRTDEGNIGFDSALVALGAELNPDKVPGLKRHGFSFYDTNGAENVFQKINGFRGKNIAVAISSLPFKCPAAPYEMVFLLDDFFKRKKIRDDISISFFTPELTPLPAAGSQAGKFVLKILEKKNIRYKADHLLLEATIDELIFNSGTYQYDLLIYVPPHEAPKAVRDGKLAGPRGWIPVDPKTMRTKYDNIYAIGDCVEIPIAGGKFLPKAGVFAHGQAEIAAHNIILEMLNAKDRETYPGFGSCFIEIGGGRAAYMSGHFYSTPAPKIRFWLPSAVFGWIKSGLAKYWKWKWF